MLSEEKGIGRTPKGRVEELNIKEDDTDSVIAFKEAMQFLTRIGGRKFC